MFKKGQQVYRVKSWDNKGTFSIERCIVDSAGKRQIHLQGADGEMRKHREYADQIGNSVHNTFLFHASFVQKSEVELAALALADAYIVEEIARRQKQMRNALDQYGFDGYNRSMKTGINEMHEPRILWHTEGQ